MGIFFFWDDNWLGSDTLKSRFPRFSHCQKPKMLSFSIVDVEIYLEKGTFRLGKGPD